MPEAPFIWISDKLANNLLVCVRPKHCMEHISSQNYLLLIRNSNVIGLPVFLFAKSQHRGALAPSRGCMSFLCLCQGHRTLGEQTGPGIPPSTCFPLVHLTWSIRRKADQVSFEQLSFASGRVEAASTGTWFDTHVGAGISEKRIQWWFPGRRRSAARSVGGWPQRGGGGSHAGARATGWAGYSLRFSEQSLKSKRLDEATVHLGGEGGGTESVGAGKWSRTSWRVWVWSQARSPQGLRAPILTWVVEASVLPPSLLVPDPLLMILNFLWMSSLLLPPAESRSQERPLLLCFSGCHPPLPRTTGAWYRGCACPREGQLPSHLTSGPQKQWLGTGQGREGTHSPVCSPSSPWALQVITEPLRGSEV